MRIVVMDEIPESELMRRSWNRLALGMDRPEVFYTYEWAIAVQRAYRNTLLPFVFAAYERDLLVGVVALARKKSGAGELSFLTADTADYCDFLSAPSDRQEFIEGVLSEMKHRKMAKIVLTNLPADSCSVAALSHAASGCRYHLHLRPAYFCARVTFGSAEQRALVKQSVLTKKRLRRNLRELGKRGTVSVRHDTNWDQIAPLLESFGRAHVARFLETGKVSNLIRGERRAFLSQLGRELSQSGWIVLSRLLVGDATAAWNYGFQFAGSWFWYQPTINTNYGNFTPGYCLLAKIIELACETADVEVVDLGLGTEEYKDRFATANRQTLYCELNKSFSGHLRSVLRDRAAALTKASPRIESAIRSMISQAAALKARLRSSGLWSSLVWLVRRTWTSMFGFDEVLFFEWPAGGPTPSGSGTTLRPLDSDLVGSAAILYGDDPAALRYLVRSAQRLGGRHDQGFALLSTKGQPVHFCWAADFDGFAMAELDRRLHAPSPDAMMIFDCFTPVFARGQGWFAEAIALLADHLRSQGKVPWIFGAAGNQSSLRGIRKTAFEYRFSLGRKRLFFFSKTKDPCFGFGPPCQFGADTVSVSSKDKTNENS